MQRLLPRPVLFHLPQNGRHPERSERTPVFRFCLCLSSSTTTNTASTLVKPSSRPENHKTRDWRGE